MTAAMLIRVTAKTVLGYGISDARVQVQAGLSADARVVSVLMGKSYGERKKSFSPKGYKPDFGCLIR